MNDVLQGIIQGTQLGMQLRREKLYQEAQQRQQERLDREDGIRDQEFQIRMNQAGARQVDDAGMVTDEIRHDGKTAMPGVIGADMIPAGAVIGNNIRKAAGGQTVRRKNRDGSTVAYELPTFEQQQDRAYRSYADRQEADENARLNRETKAYGTKKKMEADDLNQNGISLKPEVAELLGVDPSRKFMPSQIDELARAAAMMGNMRQKSEKPSDEVMGFHDFTDDNGNVITEKRYKSGKTEQVKQGRIGKSRGEPERTGGRKFADVRTQAKFSKIEEMKKRDLAAASSAAKIHRDPQKLRAAQQAAQNKYEQAIIKAGGNAEHFEYGDPDATGSTGSPNAAGKPGGKGLSAADYLKNLDPEEE